jgi:hypothetical protein
MVNQITQLSRDITEIKVGIARIEEHIKSISDNTRQNCTDIAILQKFNYKLIGAAAVIFFFMDLAIKAIFKT